jgi:hypothetical protein
MLDGQASIRRKLTHSCPQSPERLAEPKASRRKRADNRQLLDFTHVLAGEVMLSPDASREHSEASVLPSNGAGKTLAFTLGVIYVVVALTFTLCPRDVFDCRR